MTTSRSKPLPRMVRIDWTDSVSFGHQRWRDLKEGEELTPSQIVSVGFLLHADKRHVRITGHLDDNENESGCFTIPRGCITKMRRLK